MDNQKNKNQNENIKNVFKEIVKMIDAAEYNRLYTKEKQVDFMKDKLFISLKVDGKEIHYPLYLKQKVVNRQINAYARYEDCPINFDIDGRVLTEIEINCIANRILDFLLKANETRVIIPNKRIEVQNVYNMGTHYETIPQQQRFINIYK